VRKRGRVDANQKALVEFARAHGASWLSLAPLGDGAPDGILGYRGVDFKVEIKTEKGTLTEDQEVFVSTWRGAPVYLIRTEADVRALLLTAVTKG